MKRILAVTLTLVMVLAALTGCMGWLFLVGLFVFGLVMSLSFPRKNGQSISYRLLSKITKTSREDGAQG